MLTVKCRKEEKIKLFQKMSVRPYAKVMYTKTQERVKIVERGFLFERCILGIETVKTSTRTHEARVE